MQNDSRMDYPYRLDGGGDASDRGEDDNTVVNNDDDDDDDRLSKQSDASSTTSRASRVSSSFRFIGDYADPTQLLRRTPDFDSVILLLHEAQGHGLHRYRGPHDIGAKTLRHAQRREVELRQRAEHQAKLVERTSAAITRQEHDRLLDDIEPPWSWLHQFAVANCRDKSYNFLEFQSIASDETPSADSSDESFDFGRGRFVSTASNGLGGSAIGCNRGESNDECEHEAHVIEDMLLGDGDRFDGDAASDVGQIVDVPGLLDGVMVMLERAAVRHEIDLANTLSVATFVMENDPPDALYSNTRDGALNLAAIRVAIRHADEQHRVFLNFDELRAYLAHELHLPDDEVDGSNVTMLPPDDATTSMMTSESNVMPSVTDVDDRMMKVSSNEPVSNASLPPKASTSRPPLVDKFDDCQIEIDDKVLHKEVPSSGHMILGLVGTPPPTPIRIPTPPPSPTPTPTTPHDTNSSIITGNVSMPEMPEPPMKLPTVKPPTPVPRPPFECDVPAMPGIGGPTSKKTIVDFVTYLTGRSRTERGLVFPRHFREEQCPHAVDA